MCEHKAVLGWWCEENRWWRKNAKSCNDTFETTITLLTLLPHIRARDISVCYVYSTSLRRDATLFPICIAISFPAFLSPWGNNYFSATSEILNPKLLALTWQHSAIYRLTELFDSNLLVFKLIIMVITFHSYNKRNCSCIADAKGTNRFPINQNCDRMSIEISFEVVFRILKFSTVNNKPHF